MHCFYVDADVVCLLWVLVQAAVASANGAAVVSAAMQAFPGCGEVQLQGKKITLALAKAAPPMVGS
jgi:hypothetical protein